jgi:hypothetical protein
MAWKNTVMRWKLAIPALALALIAVACGGTGRMPVKGVRVPH